MCPRATLTEGAQLQLKDSRRRMRAFRVLTILTVIGLMTAPLAIAVPPQDVDIDDQIRGWTLYARFRVFPGDSGLIVKTDPSVAYDFNRYWRVYAGLPVYSVRESSSTTTNPQLMSGIGNVYGGLQFTTISAVVDYSSSVQVSAPTGDESRGFSTGRMTADWTNTVSRPFGALMPYASAGIGNTISDTAFFVRPFTSDGLVGHFELGGFWDVTSRLSPGMAAYAIRASGEQRIVSRVVRTTTPTTSTSTPTRERGPADTAAPTRTFLTQVETIGLAEIANDEGLAAWLTFRPQRNISFDVGYNRSARYDLDSVFFGVSFRVRRK